MCLVVNPVPHEQLAGRCKTQLGPIMCLCSPSLSHPPPPHMTWCMVRPPPSHLVGKVAYLNWVLIINSSVSRIAFTWACNQLDWFSHIIIFIDTKFPFIRTPQERE
jgi:hypothetical protein